MRKRNPQYKTYHIEESEERYFGISGMSISAVTAFPNLLRDHEVPQEVSILERYFHDVYNLLLRSLSSYVMGDTAIDPKRLQALLAEVVKVRNLLADDTNPTTEK